MNKQLKISLIILGITSTLVLTECKTMASPLFEGKANMFSSHNLHKKLDNELINRCFATCELLAESSASEALGCIRECNDREREQRKDGKEGIKDVAGIIGTGLLILKAL